MAPSKECKILSLAELNEELQSAGFCPKFNESLPASLKEELSGPSARGRLLDNLRNVYCVFYLLRKW